MYDKVKFVLPYVRDAFKISGHLSKSIQQTDLKTGEISIYGALEGLKIIIHTDCVHVIGSLPKYLNTSNIYTLDRQGTKEAIQKLSDSLHLDFTGAKVQSIEFGTQFVMRQPPRAYMDLLGDMPRLIRNNLGSTLYYQPRGREKNRSFVFYDKRTELKDSVLPIGFEDANLLRYEMRLNGRLSKQLEMEYITASTLYKKEFYRQLVYTYQNAYFSITKLNRFSPDIMDKIENVKDAYNLLFAKLINQSSPDEINNFIEDLKRHKVFKDKKYYTRLKKSLKECASKYGPDVSDDLIKELDDEIKNTGAYI